MHLVTSFWATEDEASHLGSIFVCVLLVPVTMWLDRVSEYKLIVGRRSSLAIKESVTTIQ